MTKAKKYPLLFAGLLISLMCWTPCFASADGLSPEQERLKTWSELHEKYGGWPIDSKFPSPARSEKEAIDYFNSQERRDTDSVGANNVLDPLAMDFMNAAKKALFECHLNTYLKQISTRQWQDFNHNFYAVRIMSVPFNLCSDGSSSCPFESSFVAKNFPALKLILVNSVRWNIMSVAERPSIAIHEFLGIFGFEQGAYGISSRAQFIWMKTGPGQTSLECVQP